MGRAKHTSHLRSFANLVVSVSSQQIYSCLKLCCYVEVINTVFSLSVQCTKKKIAIIFRWSYVYLVLAPTSKRTLSMTKTKHIHVFMYSICLFVRF
jgi:hypothetical protein